MSFASGNDTPDHTHGYGAAGGGFSGGGAGITPGTANATSGASNFHQHAVVGDTNTESNGHTHTINLASGTPSFTVPTAITNVNVGSNTPHNVMDPFMLGTWWMKL